MLYLAPMNSASMWSTLSAHGLGSVLPAAAGRRASEDPTLRLKLGLRSPAGPCPTPKPCVRGRAVFSRPSCAACTAPAGTSPVKVLSKRIVSTRSLAKRASSRFSRSSATSLASAASTRAPRAEGRADAGRLLATEGDGGTSTDLVPFGVSRPSGGMDDMTSARFLRTSSTHSRRSICSSVRDCTASMWSARALRVSMRSRSSILRCFWITSSYRDARASPPSPARTMSVIVTAAPLAGSSGVPAAAALRSPPAPSSTLLWSLGETFLCSPLDGGRLISSATRSSRTRISSVRRRAFSFFTATSCRTRNSRSSSWQRYCCCSRSLSACAFL
mmetsp:Transcript_57016/g.180446  ORF Transcript_57016/g.180446 Transcript_57016/m.180446 type:complete len:331 (+) Transcript_57016:22-1014(+)